VSDDSVSGIPTFGAHYYEMYSRSRRRRYRPGGWWSASPVLKSLNLGLSIRRSRRFDSGLGHGLFFFFLKFNFGSKFTLFWGRPTQYK
jgi:hypothetical protein